MSPPRVRDALLVLLGFSAGTIDATAFERLGNVFASVLTGNLVLLGVSSVKGDGRLAVSAGCAIASFALGAASVSALRRRGGDEIWPAEVTIMLVIDLVALVAFTVGWELSGPHPDETLQTVLLVLATAAMGVQSEAVRGLGSMSTTYLTSTVTGLIESLAERRFPVEDRRSAGIVAMAVAGAASATALLQGPWRVLPVLALAPLALVIAVVLRRRPGAEDGSGAGV